MTVEIPELKETQRILFEVLDRLRDIEARLAGDNWLNEEEAQTRLNCSRATLWRLVQAGDLPVYKYGHKNQYKAADIDTYINGKRAV